MTTYASGKFALGICDRCGWQYQLLMLRKEVVNKRETGLLVCPTCLDVDHPQLALGETPVFDPQALENPRPDPRNEITNIPQFVGFTATGAPRFHWTVETTAGGVGASGNAPSVVRE